MEDLYQYGQEGSNLRKAQLRMVEILSEVDRICRKYDLRYWIDYGTLLGAVRHQGHCIPWDDDMDLCMPSSDYHKFLTVATEEINSRFFIQTKETDPESQNRIGNIRVRDLNSLYIFGCEDFSVNDKKGIYIDIFEMVPTPKVSFKLFKTIAKRISFAYNFFNFNPKLNLKNIICYFWYPVQYRFFKSIWSILPKDKSILTPTPEEYGYSSFLNVDDLYPLQEIDFEGLKVFAPRDIEKRLRGVYGDYMQIPTPEKRRVHVKYIVCDLSNAEAK